MRNGSRPSARTGNQGLVILVPRRFAPTGDRLATERVSDLRRNTGYQHLWMLKAHLDEEDTLAELQKVG